MDLTASQRKELDRYRDLLEKWQGTINLVSPKTMAEAWTRHFLDSAQLVEHVESPKRWVDLGSGAGFPGMVAAILLKPLGTQVELVESDQRKAAFLRTVSRETRTPVQVHVGRIENVLPRMGVPNVISARALAPMAQLLAWTGHLIAEGATGLFLKGQDIDAELNQTPNCSMFRIEKLPSRTDSRASVVRVTKA